VSTAITTPTARWWPGVLVALVACLPYLATPWFDFVAYDDPEHVAGHAIVGRGLTPGGVAWAFGIGADPATDGWFNWPLTWLSHMADVTVFGAWAGGHHLVNVAIHAVNAVLVLALGRRLGLSAAGATFAAVVFAVHPAQVESVAWVSERKTVLCAALMFLSMLGYLRWRELVAADGAACGRAMAWWAGWNVLGVLALLAKPLAVTLPCALLLFDAVPPGRLRAATWRRCVASLARCVPDKLPLFAAVAATCAWTITTQAEAGAVHQLPLSTRLAHAVVAYATYLRVFLWPAGLGCFHPHPGMPTAAALLASAATLLAATAVVLLAALRGRPLTVVGWLWFLGTLVPTIGVIQVGANGWSDRYLYVPIVGLAVGVATLAEGLLAVRPSALGRRVATAVAVVWLGALTAAAWRQTATWRHTGALAEASVAASPTSAEAWNMLAVHQAGGGRLEAAGESFGNAVALAASPIRRADYLANLGRLELDAGRDGQAARACAAAVAAVPGHVAGRRGLGVALTRLGAADRAAEVLRGLVADAPGDAAAWVGLGNAVYRLGRAGEAAGCYGRALAIDPADAPTLVNRARALVESGDRAGAARDVAAAAALGLAIDDDLLGAVEGSAAPGPAGASGADAEEGREPGGGPGGEE
jgi:Flp pilus assembly protein TadD